MFIVADLVSLIFLFINLNIWDSMREKLTLMHATNKGADQPVHPHSLLSTFVIHSMQVQYLNLLHAEF